jgi:hypothetical protein
MHGADLGIGELACRSARMDAGAPERLVRVDVPDTGEAALVEQDGLYRRAAPGERLAEALRREGSRERLVPDAVVEIRAQFARLDQEPRAETPDVAVDDVRSVV